MDFLGIENESKTEKNITFDGTMKIGKAMPNLKKKFQSFIVYVLYVPF